MESKLYNAVKNDNLEEVRWLLNHVPQVDVNWQNHEENSWSALHLACLMGQEAAVAELLSRRDMDVNLCDTTDGTPFYLACYFGKTKTVIRLLQDPRVNINQPRRGGYTPLREAARFASREIVQWMIASGRLLDLGEPGNEANYAAGEARKRGSLEIAMLLEGLTTDPEPTILRMKKALGVLDAMAASIFALVIFLCDGFVELKVFGNLDELETERLDRLTKFFKIARRIPMELQMVLCHRAVMSPGNNVSTLQAEAAFRDLARITTTGN